MIWESECAIIVMLTKNTECARVCGSVFIVRSFISNVFQEMACEYWPSELGVQVGDVVVEPVAEYNMPQYILREFRLSDTQVFISRICL